MRELSLSLQSVNSCSCMPHLLSTPGWCWNDHRFIVVWCHSQYFVLQSPSYISVRRHIQGTALRRVSIDHVVSTEWSFACMPEVAGLPNNCNQKHVLFCCNWVGDTDVMRHLMFVSIHDNTTILSIYRLKPCTFRFFISD